MTEQILIDILFTIFATITQCAGFYVLLFGMLTPKYHKMLTFCLLTAASSILVSLPKPDWLYVVLSIAQVLIPALLLFKEKKRFCLLAVGVEYVTMFVLDAVVSNIILSIYGYYPNKLEVKTWDSLYCVFAMDILFFIIMIFVIALWNRFFRKAHINSVGLFFLFPLGQSIFIAACTYKTWTNSEKINYFENPILIIGVIVSFISDIVMLYALLENTRVQNMKQHISDMEREMLRQVSYYNTIAAQYKEIREYRHDIRNLITSAKLLVESDTNREIGQKLISSMEERAGKLDLPFYCNNPLVNAILWQKGIEAEEKGVEYMIDIAPDVSFGIENTDICSLLANMLDNALHESANTENGYVNVRAAKNDNMIFLEVKNSSNNIIAENSPKPKTKKVGDHGHGLEIIERIVHKYNGEFIFSSDGTAATAVASIIA